jgi:hypothetical protein
MECSIEGLADTVSTNTNPQKSIWILLLTLGCGLIFWLTLTDPPSIPARSLEFIIAPSVSSSELNKTISITLSNCSDCPVMYRGGIKSPWYEISYVSNGVACESSLQTVDGGPGKLPPHTLLRSEINIPEGASVLKIGLTFTSLTWRGRVAWATVGGSFESLRGPLARFLASGDIKTRSKIEWSDEYFPLIKAKAVRSSKGSAPSTHAFGLAPTNGRAP